MFKKLLLVTTVLSVLLGSGSIAFAAADVTAPTAAEPPIAQATPVPNPTQSAPTGSALRDAAPKPVGPDNFPAGVNPLTGLPVEDAENLTLPPALVSITNFPASARPQAGLSFSPVVYEMYVGEGMSRFLAVFYGDYPQEAVDNENATTDLTAAIGPIRSGRLPYEHLRKLYNGFLVMASAYKTVAAQLSSYTNVFGSDAGDINSAMIDATRLEAVAKSHQARLGVNALSGMRFDSTVPAGGQKGEAVWLPYNYLNQVLWRYDEADGAYHRFQDRADGATFEEFSDRLNGDPLAYENVIVLFADHHRYAETLIDIDLAYIDKMPALLFRDGKKYEISWTSKNEQYEKTTGRVRPIRFIDDQGNPFPLKPGQTWVMIVPRGARFNETVDSLVYSDLKGKTQPGSGIWAVHFFVPAIEEPEQE